MASDPLAGLVVVLAGDDGRLAAAVEALTRRGVLVGVVTSNVLTLHTLDAAAGTPLSFRADPTQAQSWQRIAPHLEQRLGPVDVVVADAAAFAAAVEAFDGDLRRRGHGAVVVLSDDVVSAVTRALRRTR